MIAVALFVCATQAPAAEQTAPRQFGNFMVSYELGAITISKCNCPIYLLITYKQKRDALFVRVREIYWREDDPKYKGWVRHPNRMLREKLTIQIPQSVNRVYLSPKLSPKKLVWSRSDDKQT